MNGISKGANLAPFPIPDGWSEIRVKRQPLAKRPDCLDRVPGDPGFFGLWDPSPWRGEESGIPETKGDESTGYPLRARISDGGSFLIAQGGEWLLG